MPSGSYLTELIYFGSYLTELMHVYEAARDAVLERFPQVHVTGCNSSMILESQLPYKIVDLFYYP